MFIQESSISNLLKSKQDRFFSSRNRKKAIGCLQAMEKLLLGRIFPLWAYILITRRCNLSCSYCYVTEDHLKKMGLKYPQKELNLSQLKQSVDKLHEFGTRWVSFFGGEPTVRRKELVGIVEYASKEKNIFTQLPTNGFLLGDKSYVDELGCAGIDLIDVSLDSLFRFDLSKKDLFHRPDLFENIFEGREKYGYTIKTNLVLTKTNVDQLEPIMEFANDNNVLLSVRLALNPPIPPQGWTGDCGFYFTDREEDHQIVDRAVDYVLRKKDEGYVTTEPAEYYQTMKNYIRAVPGVWKCDAGKYHLTVDSDGTLMQCALLLDGLGLNILDLDKNYFSDIESKVKSNLTQCNDRCLAAAYFCAQHYRKNPLSIFKQGFLQK